MRRLSDREIAIGAMAGAVISSVIAIGAWLQSLRQFSIDYKPTVVVTPGQLPLSEITSVEATPFSITVSNTSKSNLSYILRVESNSAFIDGDHGRPQFMPFKYESEVISLSKSDAGKSSNNHDLRAQAPKEVDHVPGVLASDPTYYLEVNVVDESDGRLLKHSRCYYEYIFKSKSLRLFRPVFVVDPSGKTQRIQAECS